MSHRHHRYCSVRSVTQAQSPYSIVDPDDMVVVDATLGVVTINLPSAAAYKGRQLTVKKRDVSINLVTVAGVSGNLIDGLSSRTLPLQWDSLDVVSDGTDWLRVGAVP